jgi:hypothetical protein
MVAVDGRPIVICLELRLEDDSPTGRASDGAGAAREFVGSMGLVAAIDALLREDSPAADSRRGGTRGSGAVIRAGRYSDDPEALKAASTRVDNHEGSASVLYACQRKG